MNIFRIHIKPGGGNKNFEQTFNYCINQSVLGVGWRTNELTSTRNWDDFYEVASKKYDKLTICSYINRNVRKDDLVWTRDREGKYYLAKVESGWEYFTTEKSRKENIDIANIFRCTDIRNVEIDKVPGKVVASFRARRSIQRVKGMQTAEYSKYLWNQLIQEDYFEIKVDRINNIFSMLDDEETEDLVFLFLQNKGWFVIPNSRKGDTMSYEFYLINKQSREKAFAQVKTGNSPIDRSKFEKLAEEGIVYFFQPNNKYKGKQNNRFIHLENDELEKFIESHIDVLPKNIVYKKEMFDKF